MIGTCPRCGNPRVDQGRFCASCGLDFSTVQTAPPAPPAPNPEPIAPAVTPPSPLPAAPAWAGGQVPPPPPPPAAPAWGTAQPTPPPPAAPAWGAGQPTQTQFGQPGGSYYAAPQPGTCPRCNAPLYAGSWQCGNCGLDLRGQYGYPAVAAAAPRKSTSLPQLAIVGVVAVALVGAGAFFVMQGASPKATPTPTVAPTRAPAPTTAIVVPTAEASAPLVADGTPESSPVGTWLKFKSPDGTWSASFPGTIPPTKQTTAVGTGSKTATYYYALDVKTADIYAVYQLDMDQDMSAMGSTAALDFMDSYMRTYMNSSMGGTVESSKRITLSGKPALEFVVDAMNAHVIFAITGSGKRLYMLMAAGQDGSQLYPEHFFATFALK